MYREARPSNAGRPPMSDSPRQGSGQRGVGEVRQRVLPQVVIEPLQVVPHHGAHGLRLVDAVAEALVDDHRHRHAAVFQPLPQLVRVGDRHAAVVLAVLDQRRRLRLHDVRHRRRLLVDRRVGGRVLAEVLDRERRDVGVVVVGRPVRDAGAHRDRREAVGRRRQERRDVAALAPAHAADARRIDPALARRGGRCPRRRPTRRRRRGCGR